MRIVSVVMGGVLLSAALGCQPDGGHGAPSNKGGKATQGSRGAAPGCKACADGTHAAGPRVITESPAFGLRIAPAVDVESPHYAEDKGPAQVFEVLRPADAPLVIDRMFMDCTCVRPSTVDNQRVFAPGERALVTVRHVKDAPPGGAVYHLTLQISAPEDVLLTQAVAVGR